LWYKLKEFTSSFSDVRRRRKRSLVMHKKWRRILPFVPTEDRATRLKQMASLATALASTNAEFSNELTYITHMSPRSSNQARFEEGGIQFFTKRIKKPWSCVEPCNKEANALHFWWFLIPIKGICVCATSLEIPRTKKLLSKTMDSMEQKHIFIEI